MSFTAFNSALLITHVAIALIWTGILFILYISFHISYAGNGDPFIKFLNGLCKRLIQYSTVLGCATLILGVTLADSLLSLDEAFNLSEVRIWTLHLGGALGLASILTGIIVILPIRSDLITLLSQASDPHGSQNSENTAEVKRLSNRAQAAMMVGIIFALMAAGLMALSRAVS